MSAVERVELAPGLSISRVVTGMWQIAELERHLPDGDVRLIIFHLINST